MRRSTLIMLFIVMGGLASMLIAMNAVVQPLAKDAEIAKELTRLLSERGDLAEGTRVRALRAPGGPKRLADRGTGLVLEIEPSRPMLERPGGLTIVARRAAFEGIDAYQGKGVEWVEVELLARDGSGEPRTWRTLFSRGPDNGLDGPEPPLPDIVPGLTVAAAPGSPAPPPAVPASSPPAGPLPPAADEAPATAPPSAQVGGR